MAKSASSLVRFTEEEYEALIIRASPAKLATWLHDLAVNAPPAAPSPADALIREMERLTLAVQSRVGDDALVAEIHDAMRTVLAVHAPAS